MGKQYLKDIYIVVNTFQECIKEDIENFEKKGLPINVGGFYMSRSNSFKSLAISGYLHNKDVALLKNRFYCAALCGYKSTEWHDKQRKEDLGSGVLSMVNKRYLWYAILSENPNMIKIVANSLGGRGKLDQEATDKITCSMGYALKYVVEDKYDEAREHLNLVLSKKISEFIRLYAHILIAIIEKDTGVNELLIQLIKEYKKFKSNLNTPEEFICVPALSLAKLALLKGIEITLDDPLAPREIIMPTENISYEVVNFLK